MKAFSTVPFFALISLCSFFVFGAPRVRINNGILEGSVLRSRRGRAIYAFRGIPYARPPVGALRFEAPQPPASWRGVRLATRERAQCLQKIDLSRDMTTAGSEDCLYINVYTPGLPYPAKRKVSKRYDVLVFFHGGNWATGNSSMFQPTYLLDHDILLVTMNYRLGALGFLSTMDSVIPGNYGLKDHVQALQWVRKNIAAFGGDPKRVTIMGNNAGAVGVHYLMLSEAAAGLFHRAISQSGTAINPTSFNTAEIAKEHAYRLARNLTCPTDTSKKLLQCLRTKDPRDIIALPGAWPFIEYWLIPFRPVIEPNHPRAFLTRSPSELLARRKFRNIPWLTGVTTAEGSVIGRCVYESYKMNYTIVDEQFLKFIPLIFAFAPGCSNYSRNEISRELREHYFGDKKIDYATKAELVKMSSDALFNVASATAVEEHFRGGSPVYYYYFAYNGDMKKPSVGINGERDYGVGHNEDLMYLFPFNGKLFRNSTMSPRDFRMVDTMTALFTNFVRFGKPVPARSSQFPEVWKPVRSTALENFVIKSPTRFEMSKNMFRDTLNLWANFPCRAGLSRSSR